MGGARSRYGLFMSAVGAIGLASSVFMSWYGTSSSAHAGLGILDRQRFTAVSASHALPGVSVVLLVLAGLAMLDVLLPLVRAATPVPGGAGGSVVLLGTVAAACVLFRMIDLPAASGGALALSLREGAWLALLGSIAMALGGMWPRCVYEDAVARSDWSGLPGWTVGG
jgi:hypothetical protein